jgi:hypothetical protein
MDGGWRSGPESMSCNVSRAISHLFASSADCAKYIFSALIA